MSERRFITLPALMGLNPVWSDYYGSGLLPREFRLRRPTSFLRRANPQLYGSHPETRRLGTCGRVRRRGVERDEHEKADGVQPHDCRLQTGTNRHDSDQVAVPVRMEHCLQSTCNFPAILYNRERPDRTTPLLPPLCRCSCVCLTREWLFCFTNSARRDRTHPPIGLSNQGTGRIETP